MVDISIVVPIYNEEETLHVLCEELNTITSEIKQSSFSQERKDAIGNIEILFINDGSTDNTLAILKSMVETGSLYRYINLSRNFGHQAAVSAGLQWARGNAVIIMDGDLQDPPSLIKDMVEKWKQGFDVVYAVKRKRKASFLKNSAYKFYYRFQTLISDHTTQKDSGDFSLLDRKVVDVINRLPEKGKYIRGLRSWVGFKQIDVEYDRIERKMGKSKYSFSKLIKLAFSGILSTSVKPLFLSGVMSAVSILVAIGLVGFAVISKIYFSADLMPKGWTSLMVTISLFSASLLLSIWVLSLYIAKIYQEILARPSYVVEHDSLEEDKKRRGPQVTNT